MSNLQKFALMSAALASNPPVARPLDGVFGDYGDYDDANAFGMDSYGKHVGVNPMWGAAVGGGVGTLGSVGWRLWTDGKEKWAEAVGGGVALLVTIPAIVMKRTRAAGWASLITILTNNGVRFAEDMISDKKKFTFAALAAVAAAKKAAASAGAGAQQSAPAPGGPIQGHDIQRIPAFAGSSFGLVTTQATRALQGASGPQLLGQGQAPQILHGQLQSAAHFGSTHFNKS